MRKTIYPLQKNSFLLLVVGVIFASLLIAVYGKAVYPTEQLITLNIWASIFEVLLVGCLIYFRKEWRMWLVLAITFATWSGYSFFWNSLSMPCNCLGAMIEIPKGVTLIVDILFFLASLTAAYLLGARKKWIYTILILSSLTALTGFAFAEWVYENLILT